MRLIEYKTYTGTRHVDVVAPCDDIQISGEDQLGEHDWGNLKPCPNCGGRLVVDYRDIGMTSAEYFERMNKPLPGDIDPGTAVAYPFAVCHSCDCEWDGQGEYGGSGNPIGTGLNR